ncbi:MAG: Holliday junction resolvase RuvX [Methylococcus sp.]
MADFPTRPAPDLDTEHATYLGFDYGEKRTGVAVGQRITGTASGLETLRSHNREVFWQSVARLVKTWQPAAFVVGVPYPIQATTEKNPVIDRILQFCRELEIRHARPVYVMDEALSTRESQTLFYSQRTRKSVQFADIKDELAARLILQSWLDHTAPAPERLNG